MTRLWLLMWMTAAAASCAPNTPAPVAHSSSRPLASPVDRPGLPNFAQVSAGLYRGAQPDRAGFERLQRMGVKTIVDLRGESHRDEIDGLGFKSVHIPCSAAHIEEAKVEQFLRLAGDPTAKPLFIHGQRGADRTGAFVAAYRMVIEGWTAADAQAEMRRFRFNPFRRNISAFLNRLDVTALRKRLATAPTTTKDE